MWFGIAMLAFGCQSPSSYQRSCQADNDCGDDFECVLPNGLFLPTPLEGACTVACVSSDECVQRFGEGSYCGLSGVCFERCETDEDCPWDGTCQLDRFCAHEDRECVNDEDCVVGTCQQPDGFCAVPEETGEP